MTASPSGGFERSHGFPPIAVSVILAANEIFQQTAYETA
jgi:hypothetical protein